MAKTGREKIDPALKKSIRITLMISPKEISEFTTTSDPLEAKRLLYQFIRRKDV